MSETEVTAIINRHIKPGREKEYSDWFGRALETMKKFPGYRGVTAVVPGEADPDARIVLYRFADRTSMDNWEGSPERKKLLAEVENYSTQSYSKASGLETWFVLPNVHSVVAPPKWKMVMVTFVAAGLVSFVSREALGPYVIDWPLELSTALYTAVLVLTLTYLVMPNLTRALRKWLYPHP
jgi:antibiotic biosynthesis monooxygenase (ABM) superfamily enzyme